MDCIAANENVQKFRSKLGLKGHDIIMIKNSNWQ